MKRLGGHHCAFCGAEFAAMSPFPRHCDSCEGTTMIGLITLVVVLARREDELVVSADHPIHETPGPHLPAAFLEFGETWRQTAARLLGLPGRFRAAAAESDENGVPRLYAEFEGTWPAVTPGLRFASAAALSDAFDRRVATSGASR